VRAAFTGEAPGTTLTSVLYDEPERPKSLRKVLPEGLELVIQRAMAKDPDARFASMVDLDEALAPFDAPGAGGEALAPRPSGVHPALAGELGGAETVALPRNAAMLENTGSLRARRARPRALGFGLAALAWAAVLVASLVSEAIRVAAARPLARVESVLAAVIAAVTVGPVAVAWVRELRRGAWKNTATMAARADALAVTCGASFAAYAVVAAVWRAEHALIARGAGAPPWADLVAALVALAAGTLAAWRTLRR
jgi:serine/threonine-protein kinase